MNYIIRLFLVCSIGVTFLSCVGKGGGLFGPAKENKSAEKALASAPGVKTGEDMEDLPEKEGVVELPLEEGSGLAHAPEKKESPGGVPQKEEIAAPVGTKDRNALPEAKNQADSPKEMIVITGPGKVNIRSGPSLDYASVGQGAEGETYEFAGESSELHEGKSWYRIIDGKGQKAYVWSGLAKRMRSENKESGPKASPFDKLKTEDTLTPAIPEELRRTKEISLNFESVDIREIIQTFSELLKLDYIIEPGISGNITLHTSNKIPVQNLFRMFEQILALNNIAIIKKGNFYHFLPMPEAKRNPIGIYHGKDRHAIPDEDRLIIQIIPLKYINANSLKAMIAPLLSKNAHFISLDTSNTLIVVELASNIRRLVEIIDALDINTIDSTDIDLYSMTYSDAVEISKNLQEIFINLGYQAKGPLSLKFVPLKRLNSILVVNSFPNLLPTVEYWVKKLDQPMVEGQVATFVYYLQNAEADKISGTLKEIYAKRKTKKELEEDKRSRRGMEGEEEAPAPVTSETPPQAQEKEPKKPETAPPPVAVRAKTSQPKVAASQDLAMGEIEGEVIILADKDTNSLIVRTDPKNYPAIEETIKKLDLMPLQVLIETMIMDVALDEKTSFGIEWALKGNAGRSGEVDFSTNSSQDFGIGGPKAGQASSIIAGGAGTLGLFVGSADKVMAMLKATGSESKANVLSSPVIITSENKPASISITNQVPITSATLVSQTGGQPITQSTVEYRDVGIKLSVKPKINEEKFVTMEIVQEVSDVVETGPGQNPRFFTRSAQTHVVVKDKETIIVGGLMSTHKNKGHSGIPYISKIPVFGKLFGAETDSTNKSELLIFITPHVIANYKEGRLVTKDFKEKLKLLREETRHMSIGGEGEK